MFLIFVGPRICLIVRSGGLAKAIWLSRNKTVFEGDSPFAPKVTE